MSTETTKKKIKIDNGTEFARVYTDKEVDSKLTNKQDTLVSGTNIKTINGQSILGSGDLHSSGGGEQKKYYNHFITLSGSGISCSLTITNSRSEPYTSIGDIYLYFNTAGSSPNVSATGNYSGVSGKGIVSQIYFSSPQGQSIISFTKLEIEVVENVPTIKIEEMTATVFFSSIYSDTVIEL